MADALENLADQIRHAASDLRCPDPEQSSAVPQQHGWFEPRSVVDLVMCELAKRGVEYDFGSESDLASAERSAAQLLSALGVAIPDVPHSARQRDPA